MTQLPEINAPDAPAESPFDWAVFGLQDDVRPALAKAMAIGAPAVLATLYDVSGGAPRGAGAQMLFSNREMVGFLSGGCIEADVALYAAAVLATGAPRRLVYGDGGPIDIRLPCANRINVLVERITPDDEAAQMLLALTGARMAASWVTDGMSRICIKGRAAVNFPTLFSPPAPVSEEYRICRHSEQPFSLVRDYTPPLRLIVVGGDPIALAVGRLGEMMGLETVLVRPSGPEAPPLRAGHYLRSSTGEAFSQLKPDPWSAVAVLTHDLDQEHTVLAEALNTSAGYVGALGSRRRIPERNARLSAAGISDSDIARIYAPIGLPIGGKSPWEIAVAIVAEIVSAMDITPTL